MAEGGDGKDDNPFSFKKFIKSKNKDTLSSDSESDSSIEEAALDLLGNSLPLNREEDARSNRRVDDNPFSFKRFLQASSTGRSTMHNGASSLATPDLASDLPDFVQDHTRSRTGRPSSSDAPLPDFALDSDHVRPFADTHFHHASDTWTLPPIDNSAPWGSLGASSGTDGLDVRLNHAGSLPMNPVRRLSEFSGDSDIDDGPIGLPELDSGSLRHLHPTSSPVEGRHKASANSAGGLPDFLSDSALGAADVCARGAASISASVELDDMLLPCDILTNGFSSHAAVDNADYDSDLRRLQEENQHLRRSLREAEERAERESARAADAVRRMESSQRHEVEETAALEKVVQQVEANLETATQRALHSESVVAKLKQEVRTLQSRAESLEAENAALRSRTTSDNVSVLRSRAVDAAQQLNMAASDAEHLLRQLLSGIDRVRLISDVLAATDKIGDLPSDEPPQPTPSGSDDAGK